MGLYFVQEHVRKSIPFVIATKVRGLARRVLSSHAPRQTRWPHALVRAQGRIRDTAKTAHMCKCVTRCRDAPLRCAAAAPKR